MSKKQLHIVHLYPDEMNTYGDRGNIITLTRRAEWYGFEPIVHYHHPGKPFPTSAQLLFGGGGQDSAQVEIQKDILAIGDRLHKLVDQGVPMLMICGMYQLFGHRFITHDKKEIKGIGIFDIETHATKHRLIGNIAVTTKEFGMLYGFENHSGQTYLGKGQRELGQVVRGFGNNDQDKLEGARRENVIGSYMHGSMLPLNPKVADWLILMALQKAHGIDALELPIDDQYAEAARLAARNRVY
jgi:CobQ-like glutamine amidotransferase family enzyme